jgi:hypothetical protein
MNDELDQRLAKIEANVAALVEQMQRLNSSDRRQNKRIETQQRYTMVFFAVLGVGALLGFGSLSGESRQSLEQISVAVIVAGAGGMIGVNSSQFKPPGDSEDDQG